MPDTTTVATSSFTIDQMIAISGIIIGAVVTVFIFGLTIILKGQGKLGDGFVRTKDALIKEMGANDKKLRGTIDLNAEEARGARKELHRQLDGVNKDINGLGMKVAKLETEIEVRDRLSNRLDQAIKGKL